MIKAVAIDDEPLALKVIKTLCDQVDFIDLQKTFTDPKAALKHLKKYPTDLVFVDIHMPSMSGLSLAKAIPQNSMIIFTTAFSEYAATSYELNAIEYLLKPINQKRFGQAINKARDYFNFLRQAAPANEEYLFVRAEFSMVKILLSDIEFVEGMADYIRFHLKNRKSLMTRMTMKSISERLPEKDFIRVNRSAIIPVNRIESIRNKTVFLPEREIPIGNTYIEDVTKRIQGV